MLLTYNPPSSNTRILPNHEKRRKMFNANTTKSLLQNESKHNYCNWSASHGCIHPPGVMVEQKNKTMLSFCSNINNYNYLVLLIDHFKWTITPSCKEFIGALEWLWKKLWKNVREVTCFFIRLVFPKQSIFHS